MKWHYFIVILMLIIYGCVTPLPPINSTSNFNFTSTNTSKNIISKNISTNHSTKLITQNHTNKTQNTTKTPYIPAKPDPKYDNITWTLPSDASPLRISLPFEINEVFYDNHTGIGGFGLHSGGHIEGLDHVWIELKPGTLVRSWADGIVRHVGSTGSAETHIRIDHGQNLISIHMEVEKSLVKVGDKIIKGQIIAHGGQYTSYQSSAELSFIDTGRSDGVEAYPGGSYVSPFDYLNEADKKKLVDAYKKYVLEPYIQNGTITSWGFGPYQPYLTNRIFLHKGNKGKLTGEWYLFSSKWNSYFPNDLITFIEAGESPYYKKNYMMALEDHSVMAQAHDIRIGTFDVDYNKKRVKMTDKDSGIDYYGIFEINESGKRAKLKIEYQKNDYPTKFTSNAITYIERSNLSRREDAFQMGLRNSR